MTYPEVSVIIPTYSRAELLKRAITSVLNQKHQNFEILISARGNKLTDCISIITPKGSIWERPNRVLQNYRFSREAPNLMRISDLYGAKSFRIRRQ